MAVNISQQHDQHMFAKRDLSLDAGHGHKQRTLQLLSYEYEVRTYYFTSPKRNIEKVTDHTEDRHSSLTKGSKQRDNQGGSFSSSLKYYYILQDPSPGPPQSHENFLQPCRSSHPNFPTTNFKNTAPPRLVENEYSGEDHRPAPVGNIIQGRYETVSKPWLSYLKSHTARFATSGQFVPTLYRSITRMSSSEIIYSSRK